MNNLTSFHVSEQVRLKAQGVLSLYVCEDVETLSFNAQAPLFTGNNVLTNNFINFIGKLEEVPVVLGIGNGDNGSFNPAGGVANPNNAPSLLDVKLKRELTQGRFPTGRIRDRAELIGEGQRNFTFKALIPASAYSGQPISEAGLFAGSSDQSVALENFEAGSLIARRALNYTKEPDQAIVAVWIITVILN